MKKNLFTQLAVVLLMVFVAVPASAQKFKWGVEAGLNMNKLTTKEMQDHHLGFFFGPKAQLSVAGIIIDGSVQYSQTKADIENVGSKTMPYIVVPVNVKYAIGVGSYASIYVSTGPQWNWYVGGDSKQISFEDHTFNWNVGAGVHVLKHLQVGVNYSIALQKGADINVSTVSSAVVNAFSARNNVIQVRLAYMF